MSDEFKRKLESYENGQLSGDELAEFEAELEKLEQYQAYLEENKPQQPLEISEKKQKKILRRSKWKARFQTAMMALSIFIIVLITTSILTAIYYSWGNPDRSEVMANVIDHTMTVTDPYGYLGGTSSNVKTFFRMEATRDLNKMVGRESIKVGEMKVNFLFSLMAFPERSYTGPVSQNQAAFTFPGSEESGMSDWERLENLPEGTVVSAYLSFNELLETSEVFQKFAEKDVDISWLAVDTGEKEMDDWYGE